MPVCCLCGCVQKEIGNLNMELSSEIKNKDVNLRFLHILVRTCMHGCGYSVERAYPLYLQPNCALCTIDVKLIIAEPVTKRSTVHSPLSTPKVRPFHFLMS